MEYITCKVDSQGRITLPLDWRKAHSVESGAEVAVSIVEDRIEIQTISQSIAEARRMAAKYKGGRSAVEMLKEQRRREAELEAQDV